MLALKFNPIFCLAKNIWANTKHFSSCKRTWRLSDQKFICILCTSPKLFVPDQKMIFKFTVPLLDERRIYELLLVKWKCGPSTFVTWCYLGYPWANFWLIILTNYQMIFLINFVTHFFYKFFWQIFLMNLFTNFLLIFWLFLTVFERILIFWYISFDQ